MRNNQSASCPLCGYVLRIKEGRFGIHCEGLHCKKCNANARNRFFYFGVKKILKRLTGINSPGLAVIEKIEPIVKLKILEASSYGYSAIGNEYLKGMNKYGELTCSDYYESDFKAQKKIDLCKIPYPDKYYDMIMHSHVIEHIEDDKIAFAEMHRCLKPTGIMIFSLPIQTDFTHTPFNPEYHGDNAFVYRRNGWDLIRKLKETGFIIDVYVPPEHFAFLNELYDLTALAIDNVMVGQKFGSNFKKYKELFYKICSKDESISQWFSKIPGQLELFVCRKI